MGFFGRLIKRRREEANEASENVSALAWLGLRASSRYDAARPSRELDAYWGRADSLGGDAALDPDTRRKLRERSRYEFANNCYARGAGLLWANAVVGSGPRPQLMGDDREFNKRVEWAFCEWAEEIGLAAKLRSMRVSRFVDGEAFALLHGNPNLAGPVKLDVSPFDAERVRAPYDSNDPLDVDGLKIDEYGNPVSYRVASTRLGDLSVDFCRYGSRRSVPSSWDVATTYKANEVVHWFRRTFSEQRRGEPELAVALPLFALLRRYTLAVVAAAEIAADYAAVLSTNECAVEYGSKPPELPKWFDEVEIARGSAMTLPEGYSLTQLRAEQPTTTYGDFKRELLGEIGRSLQIPVNLLLGDSSKHNYASGRLDWQEYARAIRLEQRECGVSVLRTIFAAWYREFALVERQSGRSALSPPPVAWYWDGFEHVDPKKEAEAQAIRLRSNATNLAIEYGKLGLDYEDALRQRANEIKLLRELGLPLDEAVPQTASSDDEDENEGEDGDDEGDEN